MPTNDGERDGAQGWVVSDAPRWVVSEEERGSSVQSVRSPGFPGERFFLRRSRARARLALRWTVIGTVMTHEYPRTAVDTQRRKSSEFQHPRTPVDGCAQSPKLGVARSNRARVTIRFRALSGPAPASVAHQFTEPDRTISLYRFFGMVQISSCGFLPLSIWTRYFRLDH